MRTADWLMATGIRFLRAGAFKPRTSPYAFQGLGSRGPGDSRRARAKTGIGIVTELMDTDNADAVEEVADVIQIGTRNMQNFSLLRRVARARKPVLLKRGMSATLEEWLMSAEYLLSGGNDDVILCERGVRTFSDHSRNTLDLSVIPPAKALSHLPILVDPSHGTGRREYVPPMALAALAAGADGLLIEVHPDPDHALSDGAQSLDFPGFERLLAKVRNLAEHLYVRATLRTHSMTSGSSTILSLRSPIHEARDTGKPSRGARWRAAQPADDAAGGALASARAGRLDAAGRRDWRLPGAGQQGRRARCGPSRRAHRRHPARSGIRASTLRRPAS